MTVPQSSEEGPITLDPPRIAAALAKEVPEDDDCSGLRRLRVGGGAGREGAAVALAVERRRLGGGGVDRRHLVAAERGLPLREPRRPAARDGAERRGVQLRRQQLLEQLHLSLPE